jgi:hypothetical protein
VHDDPAKHDVERRTEEGAMAVFPPFGATWTIL